MQRYTFSQNKRKVSQESVFNVVFLYYLSKVTDGSCIFDKRERKNRMDANDLTPVVTSYRVSFKTEGGKSDGDYKKLHVNTRVDNESLLRLPSSLALTTR